MKSLWFGLAVVCLFSASSLASAGAQRATVDENETIQKTLVFSNPPEPAELKIDNIDGSISVTGSAGNDVNFTVRKSIRANSPDRLEAARHDVTLDLSEKDNRMVAFVDAPYRCACGRWPRTDSRSLGYRVKYDFEVSVPAGARILLRTINEGEIVVRDTRGEFDVENVNGGIEMSGVSGSGRAYALNGKVKAAFSKNPEKESYFGSLNGDIDVYFRKGLSADLKMKTFNGNVYTDFEVVYLPASQMTGSREGGRFVYKSDRYIGVRTGKGGPELKFDAFNGNINIHQRDEN